MSSDPLVQYLLQGDLLGFVTGLYTRLMGQMFYGVVILLFSVPLYMKTQSLTYLAVLWTLLGGVLVAMVPIEGWNLGWIFLILGVAGLFYRAMR